MTFVLADRQNHLLALTDSSSAKIIRHEVNYHKLLMRCGMAKILAYKRSNDSILW